MPKEGKSELIGGGARDGANEAVVPVLYSYMYVPALQFTVEY